MTRWRQQAAEGRHIVKRQVRNREPFVRVRAAAYVTIRDVDHFLDADTLLIDVERAREYLRPYLPKHMREEGIE